MGQPVDLGTPTTWPSAFHTLIVEIAQTMPRWDESEEPAACGLPDLFDLDELADLDCRARRALGQRPILAYHATRLLPLEVEAIATNGMELGSEHLVATRLEIAVGSFPDALAPGDADHLQDRRIWRRAAR